MEKSHKKSLIYILKNILTMKTKKNEQHFLDNVKYLYDNELITDDEYTFFKKIIKNNHKKDEKVLKAGDGNSQDS